MNLFFKNNFRFIDIIIYLQNTVDQYTQAEDGKVELSLVHFTTTNPNWEPPPEALDFVEKVNLETSRVLDDANYGLVSSMDLEEIDFGRLRPQPSIAPHPPSIGPHPPSIGPHPPSIGMMSNRRRSSLSFYPRLSLSSQHDHRLSMINSLQNMQANTLTLHNRHAMR